MLEIITKFLVWLRPVNCKCRFGIEYAAMSQPQTDRFPSERPQPVSLTSDHYHGCTYMESTSKVVSCLGIYLERADPRHRDYCLRPLHISSRDRLGITPLHIYSVKFLSNVVIFRILWFTFVFFQPLSAKIHVIGPLRCRLSWPARD